MTAVNHSNGYTPPISLPGQPQAPADGTDPGTPSGQTAGTGSDATTLASLWLNPAELAQITALLQSLGLGAQGKTDGGSAQADGGAASTGSPAGAPTLTPPQISLSPDDIALAMQSLMNKSDDLQSKTEGESIKATNEQAQAAHKKNIENIDKAAKKMAAAKKKQKILGILGILGKVFAVIAAAAMTALTAGAAAPVAAALLIYSCADLVMTVADKISTSKGGPQLSLDALMTEGFTKLALKCGASEHTANDIGKYFTLGVQATIALVMIGTGIGGAMSKGTKLVELGLAATQAAKVAQISGQVMNALNMITTGGVGIAAGVDQQQALEAQAQTQRMQAVLTICKQMADSANDTITSLVQQSADTVKTVAGVVRTAHQTGMAMVQPSAV